MDSLVNLYVHRENQAWAPKKRHLPVTLVTGFLGAGKTTLLTHVLSNRHNLKVAAAVNDFAEVNIDSQIVRRSKTHDQVVELTNGCLCCSISGEFEKTVWTLLQDADIGKVNYLMIETSGITDPQATIATLEQEYGKMYRIRLDAVVTVVDTDALVAKIKESTNVLSAAAVDKQLKCADVILLNKKDLVSESDLRRAEDFIRSYVPGVQVYACEKCAVPLHYIMEVNEVSAGPQLVSHEVTSRAYTVSQEGGAMNKERQKRQKESPGEEQAGLHANHIATDEFSSAVFESQKPFSLGAFQAFLGKGFPPRIFRVKGTVWFAENRSHLYSFHMSGRQRYEMVPCASVSESLVGCFSVQLAVIGRAIDQRALTDALESCVAPLADSRISAGSYQEARAVVAKDDRFELVESTPQDESESPSASYVDFALTGCVEYGVTVQEAADIHGIDFRRMNLELVRRVNGSSGPVTLLPVLLPNGVQVCRHALHRDVPFDTTWELVTEVATKVILEFYRRVGFCKCGM